MTGTGKTDHWSTWRVASSDGHTDGHAAPMDADGKTDHVPKRGCWCEPELIAMVSNSGKDWTAIKHRPGPYKPKGANT